MRNLACLVLLVTTPLAAASTIWVHHNYVGGPLCAKRGAEVNFVAPGTEAAAEPFIDRKIRIYRSFFKNHPTCQACGKCPTYHREIYFEIESASLAEAVKAGFAAAPAPPSESELVEFERSKIYRPPPDSPPAD